MQTRPLGSSLHEIPPRYDTPHVSSSTPAKRITLFKSGDAQFGGVKMAIHRRSFKCFDALLDDLSQKVPLPFGVRTVTTPHGTRSISQLDQLQDGGCYLCTDRRYAKPIDMEAAGKRPTAWRHGGPHSGRRKPARPEGAPAAKRIVLVKNTDRGVRRSVIVSRRSAHSLRAFMEMISELMNCHVCKLYTLDGGKIDSLQALLHCPSVLVCVGQEPFRPLLVESFSKNSDEKLPGLRNRSRSSVFSDGQESKKNVNFGLETKKSIIYPRTDSSNRSTRFSLSSEKSGLNTSPGNSGSVGTSPHTKASLMNDDVEKRVLVNKDGSLSVQMRVRFRLLNDETLQWSTEIKKSAVAGSSLGKVEEPCCLHLRKSETFSEPESVLGCEVEDTYTSKREQMHIDESHSQNCCNHCQEYDIWKNPLHRDLTSSQHAPSSSSSTSSFKIIHKKESVESTCTMPCSSEEYTERVVQKATCIQQTAGDGDSRVEYCSIKRCCSCSGTCIRSSRPRGGTCKGNQHSTKCHHARPDSSSSTSSHNEQVSVKVNAVAEIEVRAVSVISNSSKVLEALREDQDDDRNEGDEDLPLSVFRASAQSSIPRSASPMNHLIPRPPCKESIHSPCSLKPRRSQKTASQEPDTLPDEAQQANDDENRTKSGASSNESNKCAASETKGTQGGHKRALSSRASRKSKTSEHSSCMRVPPTGPEDSGQPAAEEKPNNNTSAGKQTLGRSGNAHVCPYCDMSNGTAASETPTQLDLEEMSAASARTNSSTQSTKSNRSERTIGAATPASGLPRNPPKGKNEQEEVEPGYRAASTGSVKTRTSQESGRSHKSVCSAYSPSVCPGEGEVKVRAVSAESGKTITSAQSKSEYNGSVARLVKSEDSDRQVTGEIAGSMEEKATGTMSVKTQSSAQSRSSRASEEAITPKLKGVAEDNKERAVENLKGKRPDSCISARTNVSANSMKSHSYQGNVSEMALSLASATAENSCDREAEETLVENADRASSGMSNCTESFSRSKASPESPVKLDNTDSEDTERAPSVTSAKSNSSAKSRKSSMSKTGGCEKGEPPSVLSEFPAAAAEPNGYIGSPRPGKRAASALSLSSEASIKSGSPCKLIHNSQEEASDRASKPATPGPEEREERAASNLSVQIRPSGRAQGSSKCCCGASEKAAMSVKSEKSQHSDTERLTPTSIVSISNRAVEEQAANDAEERVRSAMSKISLASTHSKSKTWSVQKAPGLQMEGETEDSFQVGTPASASTEMASVSEAEVTSLKSSITKTSKKIKSEHYLHVHNDRPSSGISKASSKKCPSKDPQPESKTSKAVEKMASEVKNGLDAVTDEDVSSLGSRISRSNDVADDTTSRLMSKASASSVTSKSTMKNHCIIAADKRHKSSQFNTSCLQVKGQVTKPESVKGSTRSVRTKSSKKVPVSDLKVKEASKPNSASLQDCLSPDLLKQRSHRHKGPTMLLGVSGDSVLSNSLSADLLRESPNPSLAVGRLRPTTSESMHEHATHNKSEKSCKSRTRKCSSSSLQKVEDEMSELVPSNLPDTSPLEVVNEWLKKIPPDISIYKMGDTFEDCCEGMEVVEGQKELEVLSNDVTKSDQLSEWVKHQQEKAEAAEEDMEETCAEEAAEPEHPDTTNMSPCPGSKFLIRDSFPKGCHSSVQVMKILLSSKVDRCNSLPEVSPAYGRKLSSTAKGLLECLAKLQLVGSDPADVKAKSAKYLEVMDILQSLWLSDPLDCQETRQESQLKDHSPEHEYNPRSSSGVDVNGSSGESGKSVGIVDQAQKVDEVHGRITPVLEQEDTQSTDREEKSQQALEEASDMATPDIASRVQGSPGDGETDTEKERQDEKEGLASEQTARSNERPKDVMETPSLSNRSFGNDRNPEKYPYETNLQNTSSGMPPSVQRAQVTKKACQDPDPVWVLNLLQKLEKQFMTHYVTAMAEFKVRWDLDESVLLNTMINELKDEVQKKIQSSISLELMKIQSRAGRGPRPPMQAISRESTLQTEQRRQRLKVMRNKSINPSLSRSEENFTVTATDNSNQRSEDEFCPCDACMKKKMAARSIPPEFVNPPPLLKDFDLRKILQKKHYPSQQEQTGQQVSAGNSENDENVVVVKEKVIGEGDEADYIVEAKEKNEDTEGNTDTGAGEGDTVEYSKENEEADDGGYEGSATSHKKYEEGAENEQNKDREEEGGELCAQSEEEHGRTNPVKTEETSQSEMEGENRVEAGGVWDGEDSGADAQDEKSRGESEEEGQEEEHGDEEEKQCNQEQDEGRCEEEKEAIEETDGAANVNSSCEEDEDSKNHTMRQITKSSIESQQGSINSSIDSENGGKTDNTIGSHGNAKAISNHMYPASSEDDSKDTGHSSREGHKMAAEPGGNDEQRHVVTGKPKKSEN